MEKYLIGNLTNADDLDNKDLGLSSTLVEFNYERKPPTFGFVYLEFSQSSAWMTNNRSRRHYPTHLCLKALELPPNNKGQTSFRLIRRIHLKQVRLIDYSVNRVIFLDEDEAADGEHNVSPATESRTNKRQQPLECVLLDEWGNLHSLNLTDGSVNSLPLTAATLNKSAPGRPLKCELVSQPQAGSRQPKRSLVHLLHEKSHSSFEYDDSNTKTLRQISNHLLAHQSLRFSRLLTCDTLSSISLAELNDSSLMILRDSKCLTQIHFDDQPSTAGANQHQLLASSDSDDELLLLSYLAGSSKIVAHSITVSGSSDLGPDGAESRQHEEDKDPDQLLPKVPSFELELCWTLELQEELSDLRFLLESEQQQQPAQMCPLWSPKQRPTCWPKFLLISLRFHLILVSFEQEPVQPFSVIYDRNFLKVTPMTVVTSANSQQQAATDQPTELEHLDELVDVKLKPKLVHNFKLIGPRPTDGTFNTIFLVKRGRCKLANLVQCRHFPQMGLIVGLLLTGEVLCLKPRCLFEAADMRESLYQKLAGDSLRGSSLLLLQQIELLEEANKNLAARAAKLELAASKSEMGEPMRAPSPIRIEFTPDDRTAHLYNLFILMPCPESVAELIIASSVSGSKILTPSFNLGMTFSATSDSRIVSLRPDDDQPQTDDQLELQLLVPNYQTGCIEIYSILSSPSERAEQDQYQFHPVERPASFGDTSSDTRSYCLNTLQIKPLLSYCRSSQHPRASAGAETTAELSIEIRGDFKAQQMSQWLSECFTDELAPVADESDAGSFTLESELTNQFIHFRLSDTTLKVSSNDSHALETVRKTCMRRATEASLKLEMSPWSYAGPPAGLEAADLEQPQKPVVRRDSFDTEALLETIMSETKQQFEPFAFAIGAELRREIQLAADKR